MYGFLKDEKFRALASKGKVVYVFLRILSKDLQAEHPGISVYEWPMRSFVSLSGIDEDSVLEILNELAGEELIGLPEQVTDKVRWMISLEDE